MIIRDPNRPDFYRLIETESGQKLVLKNNYIPMPHELRDLACAIANHLGHSGGEIALMNEELRRVYGDGTPRVNTAKPERPEPDPRQRIYVMANRRNGYFKIGISVDPKFREGTLQSEEPEIELVWSEPGSLAEEQHIHAHFSDKRIRGEWFRLSEDDVKSIPGLLFNLRDKA